MGMDWWTTDPFFSGRPAVGNGDRRPDDEADDEVRALRERVAELEQLVRDAGLSRSEERS
jgi:hypothetical protein